MAEASFGAGARTHAATDLVLLLCALLLVFGIPSPVVPLLVLAATSAAAVLTRRVPVRRWAAAVALICAPMLGVLVVVQGLFYPGDEIRVLLELGPARLSLAGLLVAGQIWLRVTALVALSVLLGLGADAARLHDGLRALRVPAAAGLCVRLGQHPHPRGAPPHHRGARGARRPGLGGGALVGAAAPAARAARGPGHGGAGGGRAAPRGAGAARSGPGERGRRAPGPSEHGRRPGPAPHGPPRDRRPAGSLARGPPAPARSLAAPRGA